VISPKKPSLGHLERVLARIKQVLRQGYADVFHPEELHRVEEHLRALCEGDCAMVFCVHSLTGLRLIFLTGATISPGTLEAVQRCVREGATCVLPPRLAPPNSDLAGLKDITCVSDGPGRWLVVPEFYRLHYECFCGGPVAPILRESLEGLVGDGDHLVYHFAGWTARFRQAGGDYPRHDLMTWQVPVTQAGANPDVLEVEVSETGA